MAQQVRIDCTIYDERQQRIASVGGQNPPGSNPPRWRLTEDEAIAGIDRGEWTFYVERPAGHRVNVVVVARSRAGRRYLKTTADGERPDNLAALPDCR
jgi:hypothetical protein